MRLRPSKSSTSQASSKSRASSSKSRSGLNTSTWRTKLKKNREYLPKLHILGCMKCGTTTLFDLLMHREGFYGGRCFRGQRCDAGNGLKEKHFFDGRYWRRGCDTYGGLFKTRAKAHVIAIDATPSYLRNEAAPGRLRQCYLGTGLAPQTTFLAILRDPVYRLFSDFSFRRRGWEGWKDDTRTFGERVSSWMDEMDAAVPKPKRRATYDENLLLVGHYAEQLERWLEVVPRASLVVVPSAALFDEGANQKLLVDELVGDVLRRAGVTATDRHGYGAAHAGRDGDGRTSSYLDSVQKMTRKGAANVTRASETLKYVRRSGDHLTNETMGRLHAYFAPHNARLWALLDPGGDSSDAPVRVLPSHARAPWW